MKKIILLLIAFVSMNVVVNATRKLYHVNSVFPGPIITGIQSTTPFITAGANVIANISNGAGMLEIPTSGTNGIVFGSKAVGLPGWAGDGTSASFSTSNTKGEWVQFAISPVAGYNLNITGFNIKGTSTSSSTANFYAVAYSLGDTTMFGNASCTFLDSAGITGNLATPNPGYIASAAFDSGQNITVNSGNILYIRFYLWRKNSASSSAQFTITNFVINGSSSGNGGGNATSSTTNASICYGTGGYLFNGVTYNNTGTYIIHLTNNAGADSAATLNLNVSSAPVFNTINLTGCNSVIYKGVTYTSTTIVSDTVRGMSALHCDSIYNVANITVSCLPVVYSFAPYMGKTGDTVLIKGINFTTTTAVTFGDTTAKSFIIINDSTIKAVVGNGASGSVNVITANGNFALAGFTYKSGNTTGLIVAGLQVNSPFITPGTNVITNIANGPGILQSPKDTITGIVFGSKATGVPGWAADGTTASYTTANAKGEWVQFSVSPVTGNDLHITGFNIAGFNSSASTANNYVIAYSIGDTSAFSNNTCTFLDSTGITGVNPPTIASSLIGSTFNTGQTVTVFNGTTLYIRVYMWRRNAASSSSQFAITDFSITGTSTASSGGTPTSSTTNASICYGYSYLFNGTSYTTTGTYVTHLINKAGADSAATLILTVSPATIYNSFNLQGCTSVIYKNVTYTTSTLVFDTVRSVSALHCDSIYNYANIIISCLPTINSFAPFMGKPGDTILIKGINFTTATAVTFGDTAAKSFIIVNDSTIKAVVGNGASGNVNVITSYGSSPLAGFTWKNGNTAGLLVTGLQMNAPFITPGNNVTTNVLTGAGILELPKDTATGLIFGTKAAGLPGWAADGAAASFTTANGKGEWVQFQVSPSSGYNAYVSGFTLSGNNTSASTANYYAIAFANGDTSLFGNATCTFLNSAGVTGNNLATVSSDLLNDSIALAQNILVANGSTLYVRIYMWRKNTAASSAQFTITDFSVIGTTSIASGGTPTTSVTNANISSGSYTFNGTVYSAAGTYSVHFTNVAGADSAAILHLIINPTLSDCNSVNYNSITYNTSAVLKDTIKNSKGADSVYDVVVITINPSVNGNIITPLLKAIPNTVITLRSGNKLVSSGTGNYNLTCLSSGSNDTVKLYKNNDVNKTNGVTAVDIALLQSHILGKNALASPYKIIAGDVNGDGKVTALDIVYMKRLILGIDTTFSNTATGEKRLWTFVDSSFVFADPTNPFPYKDSISYYGLKVSKTNQTFIGCKLGDMNWDWNAAVAKPENNTINALVLSYDAIKTSSDNLIRIPVKASNFKELIGMQFTLNYNADALKWKGINNNMLNIDLGTNHTEEGKLTFLWNDPNNNIKTLEDGTVIMELVFERTGKEAIGKEAIEMQLTLDGSITTIEAVDKDFQTRAIVLNAAKINTSQIAEQWVVSPNPVTSNLIKVQLNLKEQKSIVFKLIDNNGRILLEQKKDCNSGTNNIILSENKQLSPGVYYLLANGIEGNIIKKIIVQ